MGPRAKVTARIASFINSEATYTYGKAKINQNVSTLF